MKERQEARRRALERMRLFLDLNAGQLAEVVASASRKALDDVLAALDSLAVEQVAADYDATGLTKYRNAAREQLRRRQMRPIAAIAAVHLGAAPSLRDLKLPPSNCSDSELLATATDMAEAAAEHRALFVREGLASDFVARLRAAFGTLEDVIVDRRASQVRRAVATQRIRATLARGRGVVKILGALVEQQAWPGGALIAGWNHAKRLRQKPGPKRGWRKKRRGARR